VMIQREVCRPIQITTRRPEAKQMWLCDLRELCVSGPGTTTWWG